MWVIFTRDRESARITLLRIKLSRNHKVVRHIDNPTQLLDEYDDGVCVKWVSPNKDTRGYAPIKAWVDASLDADTIRNLERQLVFAVEVTYI